MVYRITLTDTATYELDASLYTPEQAKALAEVWFSERDPDIEVEMVTSCEFSGNCPYDDFGCPFTDKEEKENDL